MKGQGNARIPVPTPSRLHGAMMKPKEGFFELKVLTRAISQLLLGKSLLQARELFKQAYLGRR